MRLSFVASYQDFLTIITNKTLLPQYIEWGDRYDLFAIEDGISWEYLLKKDGGDDVTDFETNHKASWNQPLEYRSSDGLPKVASARFVDALSFYVDGEHGSMAVTAGQTSYMRYPIPSETSYALAGMHVQWADANWGDYIDCEAGFYTNEGDETTFQSLGKFGNKYKIFKDGFKSFDVVTVKRIPSTITIGGNTFNMYVRIKCVNVGATDSKVIFNIVGWK